MFKLAGLLILMVGMMACVPAKVPAYPVIQNTYVNATSRSVAATPQTSTTNFTQYDYRAGCPNVSEGITVEQAPSTPNPYLIKKTYKSMDEYFQSNKTYPITYWMPRWDDQCTVNCTAISP